jgi:hypothetical protein
LKFLASQLLHQIEIATGLETLIDPLVPKAVESLLGLTVALCVKLSTIAGKPLYKAFGTSVELGQKVGAGGLPLVRKPVRIEITMIYIRDVISPGEAPEFTGSEHSDWGATVFCDGPWTSLEEAKSSYGNCSENWTAH